MAEKETRLQFYPSDLALATVCTSNHQVAHVDNPVQSIVNTFLSPFGTALVK